MSTVMTAKEFTNRIKNCATYRTAYIWGGIGAPITEANLAEKVAQYPSSNVQHAQNARKYIGQVAFMFDCVCLIKSILWGWNGNAAARNGGAIYASKGVPDINADMMITKCSGVSTDFTKITAGEVVWQTGHIGVYIGDGKVVECTPAWKNGVQTTACANIGQVSGLQSRRWTKHGKLPWVDYAGATQEEFAPAGTVKVELNGKPVFVKGKFVSGTNYVNVADALEKICGIKPDSTGSVKIRDFCAAVGAEIGNKGSMPVVKTKKA